MRRLLLSLLLLAVLLAGYIRTYRLQRRLPALLLSLLLVPCAARHEHAWVTQYELRRWTPDPADQTPVVAHQTCACGASRDSQEEQ